MFYNILKRFLFMNTKIKNETMEVYKKVFSYSLSIFILVLQILQILKDKFMFFEDLLKNEDFADFVFQILFNSSIFWLIFCALFFIHQVNWKVQNIDSCYIAGTWFHVFERQIDDGKNYVRAGYIKITQNYYDISVDAYNYNISLKDGELICDKKDCSHWGFSLSRLYSDGKIIACFTKNKEYTDSFSKSGIMELFVANNDSKGRVNEIYGVFSDSGASTIKGNIRLFKYNQKSKTNFDFIKHAPENWLNYIRNQLDC